MPRHWKDAFTGEEKRFEGDSRLGAVYSTFPVSLLLGDEGHL